MIEQMVDLDLKQQGIFDLMIKLKGKLLCKSQNKHRLSDSAKALLVRLFIHNLVWKEIVLNSRCLKISIFKT